MTKYNIGDVVYYPRFEATTDYVVCPDCGGTKTIKCVLYDCSEHNIDCQGCGRGYEHATGRIEVHTRKPIAYRGEINGIETLMEDGKTVTYYNLDGAYHLQEHELFGSELPAKSAATKLAEKYDAEERARVFARARDDRSWSWHVTYYRKEIRDAEKRIAYATERLNAAKVNAKEEKK